MLIVNLSDICEGDSEKVLKVPHFEFIWWNKEKGREFHGSITGTMGRELPYLERRYAQKGHSLFHAADIGKLHTKWDTQWEGFCSYTTVWKECSICGKKFDVQEY